jgi:hydroxymethylglutaryl-CoA lyase
MTKKLTFGKVFGDKLYTRRHFMPVLTIVEVSPRDGLQNEKNRVSTDAKVELILRAAKAGARRIEAVSFVNPKAVPQMADAEMVVSRVLNETGVKEAGVSLAGLVLNQRGLDRALRSGVDEANFVVLASETFNMRNQGASCQQTMAVFEQAVHTARAEGVYTTMTIGASWGCPFEGEVSLEDVTRLAELAASYGVDEIALADTIGVGDPVSVEQRLEAVRQHIGDLPLRCHFHNTRNTGLANAYAAWRAGVTVLDASMGGIGGCPFAPAATGNIASEDVSYMFDRMGVSAGLELGLLCEAAAWLERSVLGKPVPSALLKAGGFPVPDGPPETVCVRG